MNETWLWVLVSLLAGALIGGLIVYLLQRRPAGDEETVAEVRKELEEYRSEVSDHFVRTAELVNELTRSYKAVFEHLEGGAYQLVGEETLRKRLSDNDVDVDAEPVRLEYLGSRRLRDAGRSEGES